MSSKKSSARRSNRRRPRYAKKRRGPVMRFKFSRMVLLWILALILCFGSYLYNRNVHPEKDVFVKNNESSAAEESSISAPESTPDAPSAPVESSEAPAEQPGEESSEPDIPAAPTKINPVPESELQTAAYFNRCAFLGETNIHNLGQAGLLSPFNVYASEKLTLSNYTREYVNLSGTTIRILSAMNSTDCNIYLMFGTESLGSQPADQTADQFATLLNSLIATAPEATIHVMAIPPVTAAAEKVKENPIQNSEIDKYNSLLLELCNSTNVYFIDTNTALKNNDGKLDPAFAEEDGVHLNLQGGQVLLTYVLCHIPQQ